MPYEAFKTTGAVVMGRRTFEVVDGWGGKPPIHVPYFIPSHNIPEEVAKGGSPFTFGTSGIESAIKQAKAAAGDKDVGVMGSNVAQQCIRAGLLDEIQIHLVPVLLGEGLGLPPPQGTKELLHLRCRWLQARELAGQLVDRQGCLITLPFVIGERLL
jgi:dihydrofolate reductase